MLMYMFYIIFMIPLCFMKNSWWLIHNLMFLLTIVFMLSIEYFGWGGLSYFFGFDYLSYGLVMLSLWICVLMILASYSVIRYKFYSGFFLFMILLLLLLLLL